MTKQHKHCLLIWYLSWEKHLLIVALLVWMYQDLFHCMSSISNIFLITCYTEAKMKTWQSEYCSVFIIQWQEVEDLYLLVCILNTIYEAFSKMIGVNSGCKMTHVDHYIKWYSNHLDLRGSFPFLQKFLGHQ